jgi:hypothetical protein
MRQYDLQRASDVVRNGLGIELIDVNSLEIVAEVFRCDEDNTLVFSCFRDEALPFSIVRQLLDLAMERLEPFEDGSSLCDAANSQATKPRG